jgi:hypothetical protein
MPSRITSKCSSMCAPICAGMPRYRDRWRAAGPGRRVATLLATCVAGRVLRRPPARPVRWRMRCGAGSAAAGRCGCAPGRRTGRGCRGRRAPGRTGSSARPRRPARRSAGRSTRCGPGSGPAARQPAGCRGSWRRWRRRPRCPGDGARWPRRGTCGDLGLVDRWHRLGLVRHLGQAQPELRGVHRRHVHRGDLHPAAVVQQLRAQRVVQPVERVLGGAVDRLQGDAAEGQRGLPVPSIGRPVTTGARTTSMRCAAAASV